MSNFKSPRPRALQLGPDTHGEVLLMLPTIMALRTSQVNRYWAKQVSSLFRTELISSIARKRLLSKHPCQDNPEPDVRAACEMVLAIRSSFALRLCPKTMYSRPSGSMGGDFVRRAVPFSVIGLAKKALLDQFSNLCSAWFEGLDWEAAAASCCPRMRNRGNLAGVDQLASKSTAMLRIYEITSAIAQLNRAMAESSGSKLNSTSARDVDSDYLFRAFWMICRCACTKYASSAPDFTVVGVDSSVRVAVLVRALSNDLASGHEMHQEGDPWQVAREIICGLRQKKYGLVMPSFEGAVEHNRKSLCDAFFNDCVAAILSFMPCSSVDGLGRAGAAGGGADEDLDIFEQFGLPAVLSNLTLDQEESRAFCNRIASGGALREFVSPRIVAATMSCCVYMGDFWSAIVPKIVGGFSARPCPCYIEAFIQHVSSQMFEQHMLINYLLFVCHNCPFNTKLRFLKMCIDHAPDFRTHAPLTATDGGRGQEVEQGQQIQLHTDEENPHDAAGLSMQQGRSRTGRNETPLSTGVPNVEQGRASASGSIAGAPTRMIEDETDANLFARCMTSRILAQSLLGADRVALLGRSSNKSSDFWRWCIGMMVSSSAQQWQSTLSALSMHR